MASSTDVAAGRGSAAAGAAAAAVLLVASPSPGRAWDTVLRPHSGTDLTAPVVAVVALLAWALVAWLALVALLTLGSRARGCAGAVCTAVLRRTAPVAVRRGVALALGAGLALGTGGAAHAATGIAGSAAPSGPAATTTVVPGPSLDWPTPAPTVEPDVAEPEPPAPTPPAAPGALPGAAALDGVRSVVVQPGDTLWGLAEAHLQPGASPAAVAQAWPSWWEANREVIGDDPDLLHPGQRLSAPAAGG